MKIISGGQTGADRAALDAAIDCGIPHGGWCPAGRLAEDGTIDAKYQLDETVSAKYSTRTKANVRDSDVTIIFSHGELMGESLFTKEVAERYSKPYLHIDLNQTTNPYTELTEFLSGFDKDIKLNIAGPRSSNDPKIYEAVYKVIKELISCQN